MDRDLKCVYLHYFDPFLRLGPFKYEALNADPHVAVFRDFYSDRESDGLRNGSHGRLHSTEYKIHGESRYYTSQRVRLFSTETSSRLPMYFILISVYSIL
jgi:hypothetical protein